eukprot:IDg14644t1
MKDRAAAAPDAALSPSNAQSPLCENRIAIGGWDVTAATAPMAGSAELDALGDALGGLKPPSMVFARSHLTLRRGAFTLSFNAPAALEGVARAPVELCAGPPSSSRDWTYTTRYAGSSAGGVEEHGGEVIDMDALRDMSRPIRYSAAVPLFDDELDDNGAASYGVRIVRSARSFRSARPTGPSLTARRYVAMHAGLSLCAREVLLARRWRALTCRGCAVLPSVRITSAR